MKVILLKALALSASLAVAALGLLADPGSIQPSRALPASAATPLLHPDLPSYPGVYETAVGRGLRINGQSVDMHQFFTSDAPEKVASYYEDLFSSLSQDFVSSYQLGNARYVGFVTDDARFLQVMILADDEGSLVVPNIADGPLRPGREVKELDVPIPDDATNLSTYHSEDGGKIATAVQFTTELDMLRLAEFYRSRLPKLGYTQRTGAVLPEDFGKNGLLRFVDDAGRVVSVGVQVLEGANGSLVYLLQQRPIDEGGAP